MIPTLFPLIFSVGSAGLLAFTGAMHQIKNGSNSRLSNPNTQERSTSRDVQPMLKALSAPQPA